MSEFNFAQTLKKLIRERKIKVKDLAADIGVTKQAISEYYLGNSTPKYPVLIKLANFFGVSCDFLLTGVEPQDKREHQELNLSGAAIKKIKECDSEILPLVDKMLSDNEFYEVLSNINIFIKRNNNFLSAYFKASGQDFFNSCEYGSDTPHTGNRRIRKFENKNEDIINSVIKAAVDKFGEYLFSFFKENTAIKETIDKFYGEPKSWDELIIIPSKNSQPAPSDAQP
ncbi:MAG: helix-turn-helix transcriptional regulator [Synergistaceae bacterium]|nr:helix-turn-helix transcriptional regulator [Synergistaceae bacterium]